MAAISRNRSFRRHRQGRRELQPGVSLRVTLQAGIIVAVGLFYFIAHDASIVDEIFNEEAAIQRSLSASTSGALEYFSVLNLSPETAPPETPVPVAISPGSLEAHMRARNITIASLEAHMRARNITEAGKELVRSYDLEKETQPLRHLRFADLILPEVPKHSPVMQTAFTQSTVITQSPWFNEEKICNETCCAQAVAISLKQDETRIINAVDGPDLADLLLYGNTPMWFHKFHASELREEVIPCLQPGVIIHADSYRGPITRFFHEHRPKIKVPYVFITSKTDGETPIKFFTNRLDQDPLLMAWYGINPSYLTGAKHPKFHMMPLGLTGNKFRQHPDLDLLMQARNYSNPFAGDKSRWTNLTLWLNAKDTTPLLFVKFGLHVNALHRDVPFQMACENRTMEPLDNISCNKKIGANPRQTYTAASKYLFGLSPPGNGLDCFRTYEYLLNGIIPIVLHQPEYKELFEGLPVIQLDSWDYSQKELIHIMRQYIFSSKFLNNDFNAGWERLFLQHWRHKMLQDAGRLDDIITDPEGNQYYKAWKYSLHKPPYIQHATPEHAKIIQQREEEKRLKNIVALKAKQDHEQPPPREPIPLDSGAYAQVTREMRPQVEKPVVDEEDQRDFRDQEWNDKKTARSEIEAARQLEKNTMRQAAGHVWITDSVN